MIPAIIGIGTAILGASELHDANNKMKKAEKFNNDAQQLVENSKDELNSARENANNALASLGETKLNILSTTINDFVKNFVRIENVNMAVKNNIAFDELRDFTIDSPEFTDLKNASFNAKELTTGGTGGIAAGTLTAFGAYSAVGAFATASTGTAIGTLGGAAAANATLAWLGGGALSAGGLGVAGGTAVLGGLVAGPALLVGGAYMSSKAEKALNDAKSNLKEAEKFEQETKNACTALEAINDSAWQVVFLLDDLNNYFKPAVENLKTVINVAGTDFNRYNDNSKNAVMLSWQLAKTIKIVLENSILNYEGNLNTYTYSVISEGRAFINQNDSALKAASANQEYGTVGMLDSVFNLFKSDDSENFNDNDSAPADKNNDKSNLGKYAIGGAILAGIAVAAANEKVRTTVTDTAKNIGNTVTTTTKNIYNKFSGNSAPADNSKQLDSPATPVQNTPPAKIVKPKNIVLNSSKEDSLQRLLNKNKK